MCFSKISIHIFVFQDIKKNKIFYYFKNASTVSIFLTNSQSYTQLWTIKGSKSNSISKQKDSFYLM